MSRENLQKFTSLLADLHALGPAGPADTPEAESLREEMDDLWPGLSERERDQVSQFRDTLFTLETLNGRSSRDRLSKRQAPRQSREIIPTTTPRTYKLLTPDQTVRVVLAQERGQVVPHFECIACDTVLEWSQVCLVCSDCDQELFPAESLFLLDSSIEALQRLRGATPATKGNSSWAWLRSLRRLWSGNRRSKS